MCFYLKSEFSKTNVETNELNLIKFSINHCGLNEKNFKDKLTIDDSPFKFLEALLTLFFLNLLKINNLVRIYPNSEPKEIIWFTKAMIDINPEILQIDINDIKERFFSLMGAKKINIPEGVIFNIVEDNNYIYLNYNNVKTKFRKHLKDKISDIYKVLSFLNKNNMTEKNLTDLYDFVFGTYPPNQKEGIKKIDKIVKEINRKRTMRDLFGKVSIQKAGGKKGDPMIRYYIKVVK